MNDDIQILYYQVTNSGNLRIYAPNFKIDALAVTGLDFSDEDIRKIFVDRKGTIAFATLGEVMIGVAMTYALENVVFIQNVAVMPQFRRMGIACKLLSMLMTDARLFEIEDLFISCEEGNAAAQNLYSSMGFKRYSMKALGQDLFRIASKDFILPISVYGSRIAMTGLPSD